VDDDIGIGVGTAGFFMHTADPAPDVYCGSVFHNSHELGANSIALHVLLAEHNV
jgi:hypothetical protein